MTSAPHRSPRLGHLFTGLLLVGVGVLWLIEGYTDLDVSWETLLPIVLILIGVALVLGAAGGRHPGLITLGVIIAALVVLSSAVDVVLDVPFTGGVGDDSIAPTTLENEYRWAIGSMTVDLTDVVDPSGTVEMSVGLGELIIVVPADMAISIEATAGVGEVLIFGESESGVSPEGTFEDDGAVIHLIARVGMGKVEVRRG